MEPCAVSPSAEPAAPLTSRSEGLVARDDKSS